MTDVKVSRISLSFGFTSRRRNMWPFQKSTTIAYVMRSLGLHGRRWSIKYNINRKSRQWTFALFLAQVTVLYLVPAVIVFLCKSPLLSKYDLSSIKRFLVGAAPLSTDTLTEFTQLTGFKDIRQGRPRGQTHWRVEWKPIASTWERSFLLLLFLILRWTQFPSILIASGSWIVDTIL